MARDKYSWALVPCAERCKTIQTQLGQAHTKLHQLKIRSLWGGDAFLLTSDPPVVVTGCPAVVNVHLITNHDGLAGRGYRT